MRALWFFVALAACEQTEVFSCAGDGECVDGGRIGVCEESGFCSFPDATCASERRYGEYAGMSLAGVCVEAVVLTCTEPCGACQACVDGMCVPGEAGSACAFPCATRVFGLEVDAEAQRCLAAAGEAAGSCDAAGVCTAAVDACSSPGAVIAECDVVCALQEPSCEPGAPVEDVSPASLCETMKATELCGSSCMDVASMPSLFTPQQCDGDGRCVAGAVSDCGNYTCAGKECRTLCLKQSECTGLAMCDMKTQKCE